MKTFVSETYGPASNMQLRDAPKPAPRAGEVLIRVMAVSVNPADWHCMRGKPLFSRATLGFRLGSVLSFNVSATDYIYGAQFEKDGYTTNETTQNDILLGLGLGIPFGGKKPQAVTQAMAD